MSDTEKPEPAVAGWPFPAGLFLGILGYRVAVHQDFIGGLVIGLTAAILTFIGIRLAGWFRRRPQ